MTGPLLSKQSLCSIPESFLETQTLRAHPSPPESAPVAYQGPQVIAGPTDGRGAALVTSSGILGQRKHTQLWTWTLPLGTRSHTQQHRDGFSIPRPCRDVPMGLGRWSDTLWGLRPHPPSRRALDWQAAQGTQPKGDSLLSRGLCSPPALPAFTSGVMTLSSNQPPGGGCSYLTTPGSYPTTSVIHAPACKCSRPPAGGLGRQLNVEDSGREPGVPTGDGEPWVGGGGELRPLL